MDDGMINYLKGKLVSKTLNSPQGSSITVEVNGIGYLVLVNSRSINNLPDVDSDVQIFTSLVHKEDVMFLCGFVKHEDRDLFNILQSVSGVGTKMALTLLDEMNALELMQAVLTEDTKALSRTKGVGPKLAKRLVLELKDKLKTWHGAFAQEICESESVCDLPDSFSEAQSVLLALGYTQSEIDKGLKAAFDRLGKDASSEELLKIALEVISF
jgi:Holliday junction DNA helicase RuvA